MYNSFSKIINQNKILLAIIVLGGVLRIFAALDNPLSGDEAFATLSVAGGKLASIYEGKHPFSGVFSVKELKAYMSYSNEYSLVDVLTINEVATMNPPLYYLIIHHMLNLFDNHVLLFRMFSIILSLFSIGLVYKLGEKVFNQAVGLWAALFFSISSYGVGFSTMVRPYPLATLISLGSTILAFSMVQRNCLNWKDKQVYVYFVSVLLGMYTLYHFIFVFIFQLVIILLHIWKDKKSVLFLGIMMGLLFVGYLPWMSSLINHVTLAIRPDFYTVGQNDWSLINVFMLNNFTENISFFDKKILHGLIYILMGMGGISLLRQQKGRIF